MAEMQMLLGREAERVAGGVADEMGSVPLSRVALMVSLMGVPSASLVRSMGVGWHCHCCRTLCLWGKFFMWWPC